MFGLSNIISSYTSKPISFLNELFASVNKSGVYDIKFHKRLLWIIKYFSIKEQAETLYYT